MSEMKGCPSLGPTIQSKPDCCPTCDGRHIIKRGLRKNNFRHLQIYWCKDCFRYFVPLMGLPGHLKNHLEADWKDVPIEHISLDSVNEWIWKKRDQSLSWVTIKNILRTMRKKRREQYATLFLLAAASGLRSSELLALRSQ